MTDTVFFDIHTHTFPGKLAAIATNNLSKFYNFPVLCKGTVNDLAEINRKNGVIGSLILLTSTNARHVRAVNEGGVAMLAEMKALGMKAAVFAGFHQDCENPLDEFEFATENGLTGFKIHPDIQGCDIDDERFFPLYEYCEGRYPVYFHMGDGRAEYRFSEARKLLKILEKYPGLTVGAAHLGGYKAWDDSPILAGHPNVWFDTSSALSYLGTQKASELIHILGTDKCMFGTDYPVVTAESEISLFNTLDLTDTERRNIACANALKFLNIN